MKKYKFTSPDCNSCKSKSNSLLHFCHLDELDELSVRKTCVGIKSGQTIFQEGVRPSGMYCVYSGKVKLHKMGADGKEQIVRLVKPGDFIGYRALISDTPYSASATVLEEAQVCLIPKADFFSVLKKNANLSQGLVDLLCSNLEQSEKKLTEMAYKPVRERLAEALLLLKNTYQNEEDAHFSIALTRENLASLVGTAKETVIRLLSELKHEEVVRTDGRRITILKPEELSRISNLYD